MMDSNNLSLYNSTVVSQHQQNGNFEIDTKFFQVNSFGPPATSENQLQDKMLNPNTVQPPQPLQNTTYYWSEFNQLGPSNPNWGYSYPNYSMPQPPSAVPVSDYVSSQAGPQAAVGPSFHPAEHQNAAMTNNPGSPYFPSQAMHAQANFHPVQNDVTNPGSRHSAFQYVHSTSMHGAIKPETINETDMQTIRSAQELDSNQRNVGMSPGGAANQNAQTMQTNSKPSKSSTPRRRSTGVSTKSSTSSSERQNNGGTSAESYECNICNKVYEHRDSLRRHKRDFHKIEVASAKPRGQPTDFQCDICGKYLSNRCSLKRHKKSALCSKTLEAAENSNSQTKTDNAMLSSSEVSNENLTQSSYDSEKLTFHGQDGTTGSKPSTSQQLNGEIKKSKPKVANDKQFAQNGKSESCHICNKEFANRRGLGKHLKRVHNGESKLTKKELKQIAQQKRIEAVKTGENHSVPNPADNQTKSEAITIIHEEPNPEFSPNLFSEPVQHNYDTHNSQDAIHVMSVTENSSSSKEVASTAAGGITPNPTDKDIKKCDVCNKVLKKVNIARHMKSAHKLEADENSDSKMKYAKVECNYCQAVMLKGNLPRHKRSHHKLEYEKEKEMQGSPSSVEIPKSAKKAKYDAPASNGDGNFSNEYRPNHEIKQEAHQFHTPWSDGPQTQGINVNQSHDFRNVNDVTGMQVQQYPLVSQAPNNAEVPMSNLDYRNFNPVVADDQNRMTFIQHANNPPMDVLGYNHISNADPGQPHLPYGQPPNHLGINMLDYGNLDRPDAYNPVMFAQAPNLDMMDYSLGNENPQRQELQMFSQVPSHPDLDLLNYRHMDGTDVRDRDGQMLLFPSNDQNLNLLNFGSVHENLIDIHQQSQPPVFQPPPPSNPDLQNYRHLESTVQASDLSLNVAIPGNNTKQNPASDTSECPICEKMVPTAELYQHKISHELICHICGKDDIRLPDVPAHGQTHVASLDCELCGYKAQAKIKLWEHMNCHLRIKPLICLECGWSFGNSGSVQYHMKSQHSSPADLFKCDHCEKTFVTEQAKRGHELSHYGTTCPFCKQEFPRKKDLADHIKADHRRKRQAS